MSREHILCHVTWDTEGYSLEDCLLPAAVIILDAPTARDEDYQTAVLAYLLEEYGSAADDCSFEPLPLAAGSRNLLLRAGVIPSPA